MTLNDRRSTEVRNIIANHRLRKAVTLANTLMAKGFSLDLVLAMDDAWHIAAAAAGTKPPSADENNLVTDKTRCSIYCREKMRVAAKPGQLYFQPFIGWLDGPAIDRMPPAAAEMAAPHPPRAPSPGPEEKHTDGAAAAAGWAEPASFTRASRAPGSATSPVARQISARIPSTGEGTS